MPRHMAGGRGRRTGGVAAAMAAAALVAGPLAPARAGLTINLRLAGNAASTLIGGDQTNTAIAVQVWATVTGATAVTTTSGATTGDFDGLQYAYYNVGNSNATGTEIAGGFTAATPNAALGFNGLGSQPGAVQNVAGGVSVGSTTTVADVAKPRSSGTVFNNASAPAGNIQVNGNSVSFLVETLSFTPTAYAQRTKTTFTVSVPAIVTGQTAGDPAIWYEDATDQAGGNGGQPSPTSSAKHGTPTVGTQVVIQDTLLGDTNLDGTVNISDLANLATNFGKPSGATFAQGDTNGDGAVTISDLANLATNFGSTLTVTPSVQQSQAMFAAALASVEQSDPAFGARLGGGAVPEPTSLSVVALAAAAVLGGRRKRRGVA